jgi:anti-sigma factor RsiW
MLPERDRELLTAYIDGELNNRQRRTLTKLLRRSPEARKLLKEMQADSDELRALAPAHLKQDLSDSVLMLIAQRHLERPQPQAQPLPAVAPPLAALAPVGRSWPYLVLAVLMLLAVVGASFVLFQFVL